MNPIAAVFVLAGAALAVLASAGLHRLQTPYARFHAAGKASPVSFLLIAIGCGIELGPAAAAQLAVAAAALIVTLPVSTHLLFRAVHRSGRLPEASSNTSSHASSHPRRDPTHDDVH